MTDFTVEATVTAVTDGNWSELHRVLDLVPGTLLVADPAEPVLIFPVTADSPMRAALFVDGIVKLVGLVIESVSVGPAPDDDFDTDDDDDDVSAAHTEAARVVNDWIDSVPALEKRLNDDGIVERV